MAAIHVFGRREKKSTATKFFFRDARAELSDAPRRSIPLNATPSGPVYLAMNDASRGIHARRRTRNQPDDRLSTDLVVIIADEYLALLAQGRAPSVEDAMVRVIRRGGR